MKKITLGIICIVIVLLCVACGKESQVQEQVAELNDNQIYAYAINPERTDVVKFVQDVDLNKDVARQAGALIQTLSECTTADFLSPVPEGIEYNGTANVSDDGRLEISFRIRYDAVDAESMLFFKVCVAKTILQLEGVDIVTFAFIDAANPDAESATMTENFDNDSFAMSFGDTNGYEQKGTVILYFANEAGDALKEYRKTIQISNNMSLAKIVLESLIEGVNQEGYMNTITEGTTIRNVSVKDGICYVDLSDEFYSTENSLRNDIIVYSVVNSLVELPTVSKVQFLRNGEKQPFYRETMPYDAIFERNLELIQQED